MEALDGLDEALASHPAVLRNDVDVLPSAISSREAVLQMLSRASSLLAGSGDGAPTDAALAALDAALGAAALVHKLSPAASMASFRRPRELTKQKRALGALLAAASSAAEFAGDAALLRARERRLREALDRAHALERRAELVLLALRLGVPGHVAATSHAESRLTCDQDELESHLVRVGDAVAQLREESAALPPWTVLRTERDAASVVAVKAFRVAVSSSLYSCELAAQLRSVADAVELASTSVLGGLADKVERRELCSKWGEDEGEDGDGDEDGAVQLE
jgi:hypothetical protein